jgi:hypothetical protein
VNIIWYIVVAFVNVTRHKIIWAERDGYEGTITLHRV